MEEQIDCDFCGEEITKEVEDKIEYIFGNQMCDCDVANMFIKLEKENRNLKDKLRKWKKKN